jgi:hypothetical protein
MDLKELQKKVIEFRDARDWEQINQMSDGRGQRTEDRVDVNLKTEQTQP